MGSALYVVVTLVRTVVGVVHRTLLVSSVWNRVLWLRVAVGRALSTGSISPVSRPFSWLSIVWTMWVHRLLVLVFCARGTRNRVGVGLILRRVRTLFSKVGKGRHLPVSALVCLRSNVRVSRRGSVRVLIFRVWKHLANDVAHLFSGGN